MVDIFSLANPAQHLFRHVTCAEMLQATETLSRTDYCPASEPLQVACIKSPVVHGFAPHLHIPNERSIERTQEVWYIVTGAATVELYDTDSKPLEQSLSLRAGDLFITYAGGHEYTTDAGCVVLEVKNGPFVGVSADKVVIDRV